MTFIKVQTPQVPSTKMLKTILKVLNNGLIIEGVNGVNRLATKGVKKY